MKRKIVLIMVILSFVFSLSAYCQGVGMPSFTKEVRKRKMQLMGSDFTTTIYASKLSFKQIADFYSKRLTHDGWQDLLSSYNAKKQVSADISPRQLIFKKGDEIITISYLPTSTLAGETRFSLGRGKMPVNVEEQKPAAKIAEVSDIPAYPNAAPVSFSFDLSGNNPLGYTTSDSAEEVLRFYRKKMLIYRWTLEEEASPTQQKIDPQNLEKIPQYGQLSPLEIEQMGNFSIKMGYLAFKKGKRTCMIGVTEVLGPDSSEAKTIISIVYSG